MEVVSSTLQQTPPTPPPAVNGGLKEAAAVLPGRPVADFHPSVWGDYFITHAPPPHPQQKSKAEIEKRVEEMVEEVKRMLSDADDLIQELHLIDALERLGVSYHFEEEIDGSLSRLKDAVNIAGYHDNLHAISLWFRLLRQNGHRVSSDVFNNFKDKDGKFNASFGGDAKGLLSLYEAAYLGTPGEDILDEAVDFARSHLKSMMAGHKLEPSMLGLVSRALETPVVRMMQRLEARHYISMYEDFDKEKRNDTVLELAKLDFYLVQQLHWEEVRNVCMWEKELGLMEKLPFARNRVVEMWFWAMGVYFEPVYSRSRIIMTKVLIMLAVVDDFYDSYGTFDEIRHYTDAIQRWEVGAVDEVPDYMRDQFVDMINTFNGFEDELEGEDRSYPVYYLKEAMNVTVRSYLKETKWRDEGYVPTIEEHLSVSIPSASYGVLTCAAYIGMGGVATKEAFEWLASFPKIVDASARVGRFLDDIVSHEFEQSRVHVASTVECYMKHEGMSIEEAHKKLRGMVEESWKVINMECLEPTAFPKPLMLPIVNISRFIEAVYKHGDGYTHSSTFMKEYITFVLIQPVLI